MPTVWQSSPQRADTHFSDLADGRWTVTQEGMSCLCTPARGNSYPYSLVAPMIHDELSFRAAKILAEDAAAWSLGIHGKDGLESRRQMDGLHRFNILVDGLVFEAIREKTDWALAFDLGAGRQVKRNAQLAGLAGAVALIAEVFATEHANPAIAARQAAFRTECDRARAKSVLVEKLADSQEQTVSRIRTVTQAARSAVKACEYALDNLRRADIRRYRNLLRSMRDATPIAC
jgi:hypothetical protein